LHNKTIKKKSLGTSGEDGRAARIPWH